MKQFIFFQDKSELPILENSKVIELPKKIVHAKGLFNFFDHHLEFTESCKNWDAFRDCLFACIGIKEKVIILVHNDIPFENMQTEKETYIGALLDFNEMYLHLPAKNLLKVVIAFPDECKNEIQKIIKTIEKERSNSPYNPKNGLTQ